MDMNKDKTTEDKISEQIELLNNLMQVTSSIKENITQDYTLATLSKDEKEFITENYENAEYAKEIINRFGKKGYDYKFDDEQGDWIRDNDGNVKRIYLQQDAQKLLELMAKRIFTFFMVTAHMIAVLNRNKMDNFLVKLLAKHEEEEKPVVFSGDDRSILQKLKDKITGNGNEKFEED